MFIGIFGSLMPCFCEQCSKEPKPTYTDRFKMECLARHVQKMFKDTREKFYEGERKKHGDSFVGELNIEIIKQRRNKL